MKKNIKENDNKVKYLYRKTIIVGFLCNIEINAAQGSEQNNENENFEMRACQHHNQPLG
jgi:hypothetical protein